MRVANRIAPSLLVLLALLLCAALPAAASDVPTVTVAVNPSDVLISTFYDGTSLHLTGSVPEGCEVVARLSGAPEQVRMKQKGKALGLLWMNMNTLEFSGVPKVFLEATSAPSGDLGEAGRALGLEGLSDSVGIEPASADRGLLLPELVKLKKHEGLYRVDEGSVRLEPAKGGVRPFAADLAIPSRLAPGDYHLTVFAVKDGAVVGQAEEPVLAELTGMPAFMASLAYNHGVWYGVLASLIAILAGLGVGLVFQSKGAH